MPHEPTTTLLCARVPWLEGHAVVVSDRVVREGLLTSSVPFRLEARNWETKLGKEEMTREIPGVSPHLLRHLDGRGMARMGSVVQRGDFLFGKLFPQSKFELMPEEKLLYAIFGRAAEEMEVAPSVFPYRDQGVVTRTELRLPIELPPGCSWAAEVECSIRRELRVGDVLQDHQGNGYTVVEIRAASDMPADILIGPGAVVPEGSAVWKKATTLLEQKLHARGIEEYDPVTLLPSPGVLGCPGQPARISLLSVGYPVNLAEMLSIKSDDVEGRECCHAALSLGGVIRTGTPAAADFLQNVLRAFGLHIDLLGSDRAMPVRLATTQEMVGWSGGRVRKPETINTRTYRSEKDGVLCERIFGPEMDWECACGKYRGLGYQGMICDRCGVLVARSLVRWRRLGHIELARPVLHPWFLRNRSSLAPPVLDRVLMLPAGWREDTFDEESRKLISAPLTRSYQRLVKANSRLQTFINRCAPEVIIQEETRLLQNAVTAHFRQLSRELEAARENLLSKPVDFSARAVAIPDAALTEDRIGLPRILVRDLFAPLALGVLVQHGYAGNREAAQTLMDQEPPPPEVWEALAAAVASRPLLVLAETAVTALRGVIVDGEATRVHPATGRRLGLRWAGDQLTAHVSLTTAAVRELEQPAPGEPAESILQGLTQASLFRDAVEGRPLTLTTLDRIALGTSGLLDGQPIHPVGTMPPFRDRPLEMLGLSERALSWFRSQGLTTVGDLLDWPAERLQLLTKEDKPLGAEIARHLTARGLELQPAAEMGLSPEASREPIEALSFSKRTCLGLRRRGITTAGELAEWSADELWDGKILGLQAIDEIRARLAPLGVRLRGE